MTDAARRLMDADEFLLGCQTQEDSYELIDGVPARKHHVKLPLSEIYKGVELAATEA